MAASNSRSGFLEVPHKSFNDSLHVRDIYALSLYYHHLYLQEQSDAAYGNTAITLVCSRTPKKFIRTDLFTEVQRGHFVGSYAMYQIHIINIERIDISGPDGIFLSEFCREMYQIHIINIERIDISGPDGIFLSEFCREIGRISGEAEIQSASSSQEIIEGTSKNPI